MSDDQDGCEWVTVSFGTSLPPTAIERLCVCMCCVLVLVHSCWAVLSSASASGCKCPREATRQLYPTSVSSGLRFSASWPACSSLSLDSSAAVERSWRASVCL